MTARLRDAFDDLVTDVPRHVVASDLAGRAWLRGRRRRWRRRVAGSAVVVGLAALMAVTLAPFTGELRTLPPAEPADGVTDFPQAIGYQWWVRDLPDRPGPMAALLELQNPSGRLGVSIGTGQRPTEWQVVSARGDRWLLPMQLRGKAPTISPDGRYLGYDLDNGGPYVIHDLVTGEKVEPLTWGSLGEQHRYDVVPQDPAFWAPDGRSVLLSVSIDGGAPRWLRVGIDGSATPVQPERADGQWLGHLAGWVGDDEVLSLHWTDDTVSDRVRPVAEVVASIASLDGDVRRTLTLEPATPWRTDRFTQWSGVVSPDGSHLLVLEDDHERNRLVRVFSLADGAEVGEPAWDDAHAPVCPATWTGSAPAVPVHHRAAYHTTAVTAVPVDDPHLAWHDGDAVRARLWPVVAVAPGLGVRCIMWAEDALAEAPKDGPFSLHSDASWSWPWRELHYTWFAWLWRDALALIGLIVATVVVVRWRRRRREVAAPDTHLDG